MDSTKKVIWTIVAILILLTVYFIMAGHITPNTNDAHVENYVVQITPQVSGRIEAIYVHNNQEVKKGQALLRIEKKSFEYQLEKAQADLIAAQDQTAQLKTEIAYMQAVIKQRSIDVTTANAHYQQYKTLAEKGVVSKSMMLDETKKLIDTQALLEQAKQNLIVAQQKLGPDKDGVNIHIRQAEAAVKTAELNLAETTVYASVDGKITNLSTSPGDYASAGSEQMALVQNDGWWIQANFEENNLPNIRLGKKVLVSLKMFPGHLFTGHVVSISNGISTRDSSPSKYLPFVEKTDNWIRLSERFPVDIKLDNFDINDYSLKVSASAHVFILTDHGFFWNSLAYFWSWFFTMINYL